MKIIITRIVLIALGMFSLFPFFCSNSIDFNEIDAVSSASGNIKITSGRAYKDYAIMETYHKDSYTFHFIAYGILGNYGDTVVVADTPRVHLVTIPNLEPGTAYNFKFVGHFPANPEKENHYASGSFATVSRFPQQIVK